MFVAAFSLSSIDPASGRWRILCRLSSMDSAAVLTVARFVCDKFKARGGPGESSLAF